MTCESDVGIGGGVPLIEEDVGISGGNPQHEYEYYKWEGSDIIDLGAKGIAWADTVHSTCSFVYETMTMGSPSCISLKPVEWKEGYSLEKEIDESG
jgi:hypothetical protein